MDITSIYTKKRADFSIFIVFIIYISTFRSTLYVLELYGPVFDAFIDITKIVIFYLIYEVKPRNEPFDKKNPTIQGLINDYQINYKGQ